MTTNVLEALFPGNTTVTGQEQRERNRDVAPSSGVIPGAPILPERRCEVRVDYRCMCTYEIAEAIDEELAFIEQGEAFALNRSAGGILLIMGHARHVTQLIEVHTFHSRWGRTTTIYEARWAKPIQVESLGNLYLVGSRQIFGL
ncbi:MAG: hypothetical protein ACREJN_00580 [Nitrospiraceae bacterium]